MRAAKDLAAHRIRIRDGVKDNLVVVTANAEMKSSGINVQPTVLLMPIRSVTARVSALITRLIAVPVTEIIGSASVISRMTVV